MQIPLQDDSTKKVDLDRAYHDLAMLFVSRAIGELPAGADLALDGLAADYFETLGHLYNLSNAFIRDHMGH